MLNYRGGLRARHLRDGVARHLDDYAVYGVNPDVEVTIAPHDWAADRDPQLDTAIRLALQALEQGAPAAPPSV